MKVVDIICCSAYAPCSNACHAYSNFKDSIQFSSFHLKKKQTQNCPLYLTGYQDSFQDSLGRQLLYHEDTQWRVELSFCFVGENLRLKLCSFSASLEARRQQQDNERVCHSECSVQHNAWVRIKQKGAQHFAISTSHHATASDFINKTESYLHCCSPCH